MQQFAIGLTLITMLYVVFCDTILYMRNGAIGQFSVPTLANLFKTNTIPIERDVDALPYLASITARQD